jgi:hypothetical protein
MSTVSIRKDAETRPKAKGKSVETKQSAIDALPLHSGEWRIAGNPGFYIRCRKSKKFRVLKWVKDKMVPFTLKATTLKEALKEYRAIWDDLKPKPDPGSALTLGPAIEAYLNKTTKKGTRDSETGKSVPGKLADRTQDLARYNAERYLADWATRTLKEIAEDRLGIQRLQNHITNEHGMATSNQVIRLLAAVYRWHQDFDDRLTIAWPRKAAVIHDIPPRDWAFETDADLRAWWTDIKRDQKGKPVLVDGKPVRIGVSAVIPLKRMFWLLTLFTGARNSAGRMTARVDYNREKKTMHFRENKGNPAYTVPLADVVVTLLDRYLASGSIPSSRWLFPSPKKEGEPLGHVKEPQDMGIVSSHHLRHNFKTILTTLGRSDEQEDLLMGHSLGKKNVGAGYLTITDEVIESLRPLANKVAERYLKVIPEIRNTTF